MQYQLLAHSESTAEFNWSHLLFIDLWRFRGHLDVKLIEPTSFTSIPISPTDFNSSWCKILNVLNRIRNTKYEYVQEIRWTLAIIRGSILYTTNSRLVGER